MTDATQVNLLVDDAVFTHAVIGTKAYLAKNAEGLTILSGYIVE